MLEEYNGNLGSHIKSPYSFLKKEGDKCTHSNAIYRTGDPARPDEKFLACIGFFTKVLREGDCKIEDRLKRGVMAGLGSVSGQA